MLSTKSADSDPLIHVRLSCSCHSAGYWWLGGMPEKSREDIFFCMSDKMMNTQEEASIDCIGVIIQIL